MAVLPEVEIVDVPAFTPAETAVLDHYSCLNLLGLLSGELGMLGFMLEDRPGLFEMSLEHCNRAATDLRAPETALACATRGDAFCDGVIQELALMSERHVARFAEAPVATALARTRALLDEVRCHAREIVRRREDPQRWECYPPAAIRESVARAFAAIENRGRNRFRIVYTRQAQGSEDYYVELGIDPAPKAMIWMPPVMLDVMRDLIGNARKYTNPGGWISAGLAQRGGQLRFTVRDSGRGIPTHEVKEVARYGRRGSNARDVTDCGGGLGLTRALSVARRFGGRLWIGSVVGIGTQVRLVLPAPRWGQN